MISELIFSSSKLIAVVVVVVVVYSTGGNHFLVTPNAMGLGHVNGEGNLGRRGAAAGRTLKTFPPRTRVTRLRMPLLVYSFHSLTVSQVSLCRWLGPINCLAPSLPPLPRIETWYIPRTPPPPRPSEAFCSCEQKVLILTPCSLRSDDASRVSPLALYHGIVQLVQICNVNAENVEDSASRLTSEPS